MHFFDTNFLVRSAASLPDLIDVPDSLRWITETTQQEVIEKLGPQSARAVFDGAFHTLSFNDLYQESSEICPVYYWYILAMYNPANLGGEDFVEQSYTSTLIRGETITEEDKKAYEDFRCRSSNSYMLDPTGKPKGDFLRHLERLQARVSKKAKMAARDRHPAYLRDIRTLSLILYHTLTSKSDVLFYTTDGDVVPLLLKWLESMCMRLALGAAIGPTIDHVGRRTLMRGGTVVLQLDYDDFVRRKSEMYAGLINDSWKQTGVRITIRHWNLVRQHFEEDVWLTFPGDVADVLSMLHGNFSCPFTKNNTLWNWVHIRYYWPPTQPQETKLRVEVTKKAILNRASRAVSTEAHDKTCKYRQQDACGQIAAWSDFS